VSQKNLQGSYQTVTSLSADLATKIQQVSGAMSADLPSATNILVQALEDPVQGLSRLSRSAGIDFPAATVKTIDALANMGDTAGADSYIYAALQGSIGGAAAAAANAPGGGLIQLENHLTALGEDSAEGDQSFRRDADHGSGRKPIRRRSEATLTLRCCHN
jgi:hypothetical protein